MKRHFRFTLFGALIYLILSAQTAIPTIDLSGTVTAGGTFQSVTLPSGVRNSIEFQNICSISGNCTSTSDTCEINFGSATPTAANSLIIAAGNEYLRSSGSIPNDNIKLTCTSTGDKFLLKVQ